MAYKLRDRNKQVPNGLRYRQAETNWEPARYSSFDRIVNGLITHRKSNPHLVAAKKWATDYDTVAQEVDAFNALNCARHGWNDYILSDAGVAPPPKPMALLQQEKSEIAAVAGKAILIWSGIKTLDSWIDSGTPPVPQALSNSRAATCAACPKNGTGEWETWFTKPAAAAIKKQIERREGMKLKTTSDDKIKVCLTCLCPLALKVHTPVSFIKEHMRPELLAELVKVPGCWIPKEAAAQ